MKFERFSINGPILVIPSRLGDHRGWFSETFRLEEFSEAIGGASFVQHNQSMSAAPGTVRGLHFQSEPKAQGKLVRCLKGAIMDVVVDVRRWSPSFGQHITAELTAENGHQLWVPIGFAHGFITRQEDTEIFYMVTNYYSPEHDRGLLWNDPALAISWSVAADAVTVSERDRKWPVLRDLADAFV